MNQGGKTKRETPEECLELCQETPGCFGFTWGRNGDECWLKNGRKEGKKKEVEGRVSGTRYSCKGEYYYQP